jgi:xylose isomerase
MNLLKEVMGADIVITIGRDGIKTIKNRNGNPETLDLIKVLEMVVPYQKEYLHPLIFNLINKLKVYRVFI